LEFIRTISSITILSFIIIGCSTSSPILKSEAFEESYISEEPETVEVMEISHDDRFIAFNNGTVKETKTGLMWAAADNGEDITWDEGRKYCAGYEGGRFTDWRMPTQDELAGIYDPEKINHHGYSVSKLINISACCPWPSNTMGPEAAVFSFSYGGKYWLPKTCSFNSRALPVRDDK